MFNFIMTKKYSIHFLILFFCSTSLHLNAKDILEKSGIFHKLNLLDKNKKRFSYEYMIGVSEKSFYSGIVISSTSFSNEWLRPSFSVLYENTRIFNVEQKNIQIGLNLKTREQILRYLRYYAGSSASYIFGQKHSYSPLDGQDALDFTVDGGVEFIVSGNLSLRVGGVVRSIFYHNSLIEGVDSLFISGIQSSVLFRFY